MHELSLLLRLFSGRRGPEASPSPSSLPFAGVSSVPAVPGTAVANHTAPDQHAQAWHSSAVDQLLTQHIQQQQQQHDIHTLASYLQLLSFQQTQANATAAAIAALQCNCQQSIPYNQAATTAHTWQLIPTTCSAADGVCMFNSSEQAAASALLNTACSAVETPPYCQTTSNACSAYPYCTQMMPSAAGEMQLHCLRDVPNGVPAGVLGGFNTGSSHAMPITRTDSSSSTYDHHSGGLFSAAPHSTAAGGAGVQFPAARFQGINSSCSFASSNLFNLGKSSSSSWGNHNASAAITAAATALVNSKDEEDGQLVHNHFCQQDISLALNATATVLLNALRSLQYGGENPYPRSQRLYVCGLREACKAIKAGTAKAVILAPDVQLNKLGRPDRVLDSRMNEIMMSSKVPRLGCAVVPVVFALSRKKIGQVFGSKKRMSAIAIIDVQGIEDLFAMMLQLAEEGRQRWAEMQNLSWTCTML